MLPPELSSLMEESLRGHAIWPAWTYARIKCDYLVFSSYPPKVLYITHHPKVTGRALTVEEVPAIIEEIKRQVITRRMLGEEY